MNVDGIILASGKTQSKSSRALWRRFIERDTFNIWAQDFNDLRQRSSVEFHEDELHCTLPVYERYHSKYDVRLIAVRN